MATTKKAAAKKTAKKATARTAGARESRSAADQAALLEQHTAEKRAKAAIDPAISERGDDEVGERDQVPAAQLDRLRPRQPEGTHRVPAPRGPRQRRRLRNPVVP